MSKSTTFLQEARTKDAEWLRDEVTKRDAVLRTLKFDLGFGKVEALRAARVAKRERAQLLTLLTQQSRAPRKED